MASTFAFSLGAPLARCLVRPYASGDPDAAAYVAAVAAAGATVSADQAKAIDTFVKGEKAAGRWALHKRLWFPVWADAEANAIDMVSLASGEWINPAAVEHQAGYIRNVDSNGQFDSNSDPAALGLTTGSATLWHLCTVPDTRDTGAKYIMASYVSGQAQTNFHLISNTGTVTFQCGSPTAGAGQLGAALDRASQIGIIAATRRTSGLYIYQRRGLNGTFAELAKDDDEVVYGTMPAVEVRGLSNVFGGYNYAGTVGAWGLGLGLTAAQAQAFTAAVETLWETVTGLTMP